MKRLFVLAAVLAVLAQAGCGREAGQAQGTAGAAKPAYVSSLRLSTTTSTENSGLLGVLLPPFEKRFGIRVDVVAVGSGKALKLGETGDVDVVLAHARPAEDAFVAKGFGVGRRDVMHNDFIVIGPAGDPAGIKNARSAAEAFRLIAEKGAPFASRGDDSGTHQKEKLLWVAAGVAPKPPAYMETGQGMGETMIIAAEKRAYCLADRGTYIPFASRIDLGILFQGDEGLYNAYGIMAVNPERHPKTRYLEAMALIAWVTSPEGQKIIGDFKPQGEQLFFPDAVKAAR